MNQADKNIFLAEVTRFYLESHDFNGIPIHTLQETFPEDSLLRMLTELIEEDKVSVVFGNAHPNPHIRALEDIPKEEQIKLLSSDRLEYACAYPLPKHLEKVVDRSKYDGRPYQLLMALGVPQLAFRPFDLAVLEHYRNDPRYRYVTDDIQGQVVVHDEYYQSNAMAEKDQVLLQTFGYCYDDELNRAVAVFLRYLAHLSPEHQQIWKAKELSGSYKLHPDYFCISILGEWGKGISIFSAFVEEIQVINKMVHAMGRPNLLREDFTKNTVPVEFSFLVRPTLREYNNFVHLLDKMISENIEKDFFRNEVSYEYDEQRADGKVVVRQKGTLALLDEWIHIIFRTTDWEPIDEALKTFREIRKLRQAPAHAIKDDEFDQKYFHLQRELIIRAYNGLRILRLMLANHPSTSGIEIHPYIERGDIWTY